jgi:hypothetical protein
VLAEFGRTPLMHQVARDAGDIWEGTGKLPPERLRWVAMEDSTRLWLRNHRTGCWAGHFLACMQEAGVVAAEQLDAYTTVQQVWALGITRRSAVTALAAVSAQVRVDMPMDPRAIVAGDPAHTCEHINACNRSDTGRVACAYARWVHAGAVGAPHLGTPLPTRVHQDLVRLRVTSAPLRVITGTFEGAGHCGIPHAERVCALAPVPIALPYPHQWRI